MVGCATLVVGSNIAFDAAPMLLFYGHPMAAESRWLNLLVVELFLLLVTIGVATYGFTLRRGGHDDFLAAWPNVWWRIMVLVQAVS